MKKIISLCLLFACLHSNAQKNSIAIKAGLGFVNVKKNGSSASGTLQPSFGLEGQMHLINLKNGFTIFITPDLMYQPTGYESNGLTAKVNYLDFSLPVLLFIGDSRFGLYGGLGPFIGYGLSGKFSQSGSPDMDVKFGDGVNDNRTAFNSGWVFKAGMKVGKFTVNLEAFSGSKNLIPKDRITPGQTIKSTAFYATMTYDIF